MHTFWQQFQFRFINFYPPFLGAGIHSHIIDEYTIRVEMKLNALNRNIYGTHFGGSLYSMCDPWFVLILLRNLGKDYIVWDKSATIKFIQPGHGTVSAIFNIPRERINEIRLATDGRHETQPNFSVDVKNDQGEIVAYVEKLLYIRRK
jgi:hypothetical protein